MQTLPPAGRPERDICGPRPIGRPLKILLRRAVTNRIHCWRRSLWNFRRRCRRLCPWISWCSPRTPSAAIR